MQNKVRASAVLALYLISLGCATRPVNMNPTQSAEYTVAQSLAVLAESNKAATASAIKLNEIGVLPTPTTRAILKYTGKIATVDQAAIDVLKSGATWPDRSAAILKLIGDLKVLPPELSELLASPATDEGIKGLISIVQSIQMLIGTVSASTGGQ